MGIYLKEEPLDNIGIFLDGDVYTTQPEKEERMRVIFSGNEEVIVHRRQAALSSIRQFNLPLGTSPETYINNSIREINDGSEIVEAARGINEVRDKHDYVDQIVHALGYPNQQGLAKVVDTLSVTPDWQPYTQPLRDWLVARTAALNL